MAGKETNPVEALKEAGEKIRTPDFLNNVKGEKKKAATDTLNGAEQAASSQSGVGGAAGSSQVGGLYTGKGTPGLPNQKQKGKFMIKKAPSLVAIALVVILLVVIIPSLPFIAIGTIDHNLQDALGFTGTSAIMEKIAIRIVANKAASGKVPAKLANEFADSGIVFGQLTAYGDFVRTSEYIANLDDSFEVAASGFDYRRHGAEGELSVLYDGEIINARDFVLAVESNPKMYADSSEALDIKARFYYSDDVSEVYDDLGLNRAVFANWTVTGNEEEDEKNFYDAINEILEDDISATIAGCDDGENGTQCDEKKVTSSEDAINDASAAGGNTVKAAQLLNMAISSSEPQKAAKAFLAIEEPIQRARISGEGPINQVMNALNRQTEFNYVDVNTGEEVTTKKSILETPNFVAAISGGDYSKTEANNFSRDRVFVATDLSSDSEARSEVSESTLGGNASSDPKAVLEKARGEADKDVLSRAQDSVKNSVSDFTDELFTSVKGGNRAIEGGSYISNTINQRNNGAMPSDAETVARYEQEVDEVLARKANAERASLSPFDISSSNTFLGNIVDGLARSYLTASSRGDSGFVSAVGALAVATSKSTDGLLGKATADGSDRKFTSLDGDCTTVSQAANVVGDLYCNSHNTISTKYIDYTEEQWNNVLNDKYGSDEEAEKVIKEYALLGGMRDATVGVKSAAVCSESKKLREEEGKGGGFDVFGFFSNIVKKIASVLGIEEVFDECDGEDSDVATGAKYTLSSSNSYLEEAELMSGYMVFDRVNSLLEETESNVSRIRKEYYKKHPKDNSPAGRIARFSGMSKSEAEIALGFAAYLARINGYDASQRFAFGKINLNIEKSVSIVEDEEIKETLYCYWRGKVEYSDLRNRSQVA